MKTRLSFFTWIVMSMVCCGGQVDGVGMVGISPDTTVDKTRQAIRNGAPVDEEGSGHVALQYWKASVGDYSTFCSAELYWNNLALTAAHCLRDMNELLPGTTIYGKMGSQRIEVTGQWTNAVWDKANLVFASSFTNTRVAKERDVRNSELEGKRITCYGHGPGGVNAQLTSGDFVGTFNDITSPKGMIHLRSADGSVALVAGDSGGGCFVDNDYLAYIQSGTFYNPDGSFDMAYGSTVEDWAKSLRWSNSGSRSDYASCVQINEPSDPHTWDDNYLCSGIDIGLRWSYAGPIEKMRCTQILEASDPDTWDDNYLCVPEYVDVHFVWSSSGELGGNYMCLKWSEPSDPDTWDDNYLCWL